MREYIRKGEAEGATLVVGGADQPDDKPSGYYVKPTLFANVTPDMTIAQEEIFGPVLSVIPYADEDDAIRIANGTIYGLAGAVQSADPERAEGQRAHLKSQRDGGRSANAHRPGGHQRCRVQSGRALRRIQTVRRGPRAWPLCARRVLRDQSNRPARVGVSV